MTIRYVLFMPVKVYQYNIIAVNGAYGWLRSGSHRGEVASDCHIFIYDVRYNRTCALIENDLCDH